MLIHRIRSAFAALAALTALAVYLPVHAQEGTPPAAVTASPEASASAAPAEPIANKAAAPGAAAQQEVANPYGLGDLWSKGDLVARGTLLILVVMSAGSWYILVTKLYESFKLSGQAREARQSFFKAGSLQEGATTLKDGSAFRYIAETGIEADEHHDGELTENIDRNTWITLSVQRSIDDIQARQQDGLAFLGTVGSTAPFIGLFGTVWGILHALTAIGIAGQASIDKVAGPVGESLLMTAIGLGVAVPAVLGYNWLVRRNKVTLDAARSFAAELHGVLLGAKPIRGVAGSNATTAALPVRAAVAAG
jgi:biopolymer transport protein ExbB